MIPICKISTQARVMREMQKYSYPRLFWGRNYAGTVDSPFQLMHYLLKDGVVHIEIDDTTHEWSFIGGVVELRVVETQTWEVLEVCVFD